MNPLMIGGAAVLVALLATGSSASTAASQDQMVFKDYQWVTSLPATLPIAPGLILSTLIQAAATGRWPAPSPLATKLPPPPNTSATGGRWAHYPCGYQKAANNFVFPIFPGVPGTVDIYAWIPSSGWSPTQPNVLNVTKINGYWVTWAPYHVSTPAPHQLSWTASAGWPPPPPGETTGHWWMAKPGYCVWTTPMNSNSGTQATYGFNLGATPAPAAAPIATTPTPAYNPNPPETLTPAQMGSQGYGMTAAQLGMTQAQYQQAGYAG